MMTKEAITSMLLAGWSGFFLASTASAQFHTKSPEGRTGVNPQAVQSAHRQSSQGAVAGQARSGAATGGGLSGGDMILPPDVKEALSDHNVRIGRMHGKQVDIWGRAIHHSDGSYTESKKQVDTNTIEQLTKSKGGVTLQRRLVMLDERGNPAEVLIYDGNKQFKYRGLQIYDRLGRFAEEQIYDAEGTLIRRKVQEYDLRGNLLPARSWDYVANVPADLRLVISGDDEKAPGSLQTPSRTAATSTGGAKGRTPVAAEGASISARSGEGTPRRGLNLPKIFTPKK